MKLIEELKLKEVIKKIRKYNKFCVLTLAERSGNRYNISGNSLKLSVCTKESI